jgi:hypothetical protein
MLPWFAKRRTRCGDAPGAGNKKATIEIFARADHQHEWKDFNRRFSN